MSGLPQRSRLVSLRKLLLSVTALISIGWVSCILYVARYAMLDDALIHLRYADFLHRVHFITYDGVKASFGTSSLLYVGLLALLRSLTTSPLLPKFVSVVFYCGSLFLLISVFKKMRSRSSGRFVVVSLLFLVLSTMGIRWLTDGMETSLVVVVVLTLAIWTDKELHTSSHSVWRMLASAVLGSLS